MNTGKDYHTIVHTIYFRFDEDVNAMVVVPSHRISEKSVR